MALVRTLMNLGISSDLGLIPLSPKSMIDRSIIPAFAGLFFRARQRASGELTAFAHLLYVLYRRAIAPVLCHSFNDNLRF